MTEIETIVETVNNLPEGREMGCLSMHAERLLVTRITHLTDALDRIIALNLGDCPASMDEADFARAHNYRIRRIARGAVLAPTTLTPTESHPK